MFTFNFVQTIESFMIGYARTSHIEINANQTTGGLNQNVEDILNNINNGDLNDLLNDLDGYGLGVFGSRNFMDTLRAIIAGEDIGDFNSVFGFLINIFFSDLVRMLPFILAILGICATFSIISSVKGGFSSDSVENIIRFACVSLISVILFSQIFSIISSTASVVNNLTRQINIVFPLILTMMAASGAVSTAASYTPAVAILGQILTTIILTIALPTFILSIVFDVVGNLSDTVRLKKLSSFFSSTLKWVMGTAFFVFLAFLSVRGITASVRDTISLRTARFAINNYVPIIGGYLSEGMNLIMAGSTIVKNAIGFAAIILLLVTIAPLVINIMVLSLSLSLLGAIIEPFNINGVSDILTSVSKSLKSLLSIILGISFLYFIFLMLTINTGNMLI
ncbi:MAG: stage III sporulation protein AE [Firmicutes bacterium]|nr:stage III sporulation protein AE [Bacillota bacterium]